MNVVFLFTANNSKKRNCCLVLHHAIVAFLRTALHAALHDRHSLFSHQYKYFHSLAYIPAVFVRDPCRLKIPTEIQWFHLWQFHKTPVSNIFFPLNNVCACDRVGGATANFTTWLSSHQAGLVGAFSSSCSKCLNVVTSVLVSNS